MKKSQSLGVSRPLGRNNSTVISVRVPNSMHKAILFAIESGPWRSRGDFTRDAIRGLIGKAKFLTDT